MGDGQGDASALATRRIVLAREDIRRVGPLVIEPSRRLIRHRDGRSATLEPRTMQVLIALLEADGVILSRDDLIQSCWEGRIVGDDSISSVVYRLRRDLRDVAAGELEVETITKVGFRVVRGDVAAVSAGHVEPEAAALESPSPSATRVGVWRGRGRAAAILGGLLLVALMAFGFWWTTRERPPHDTPLSLTPVAVVGGGLEPTLPAAFADALRVTLSDVGVPVAARESELRLSTGLRRSGAGVEVTTRLDDLRASRTLWNQSLALPSLDEHALVGEANRIARVVKCGMPAIGERAPPRIVAMLFRACGVTDAGVSLERARELRDAAPQYAFAQLAVAGIAPAVLLHHRSDEAAVRREGLAAAARAIALQPRLADGYVWRAMLTPFQDAAARERMLREALSKPSAECACAVEFLGDFLTQAGRVQEGLVLYQQGYDRDQNTPLPLYRLIRGLDYVGQHARAEALLDRYESAHGPRPDLRYAHVLYLEHGSRSVGRKPFADPTLERAAALAMSAIESGDQAARVRASALLKATPVNREIEFPLAAMLSELGDSAGAMNVLETSRRAGESFAGPGRYPGLNSALLWDPRLRGVLSDPGFAKYLRSAGYFTYWRATKSAPDVCRAASPPHFCTEIL